MNTLLFIDSCPRDAGVSRTRELCQQYIDSYSHRNPNSHVEVLTLANLDIAPLTDADIQQRYKLLAEAELEHRSFLLSRQFSQADDIVIGAPFWDLSFPSILKVYIESICVNSITFEYTDKGPRGLSKFRSLVYLTTSGGNTGAMHCGVQYMHEIASFLGTGTFGHYTAEGLDVHGNDVQQIMQQAKAAVTKLVL